MHVALIAFCSVLMFLLLKLCLVGAVVRRQWKKEREKGLSSLLNSYFVLALICLFHSLLFQQ